MKFNLAKLVCVPITETQSDRFLSAIIDASQCADIIELRLDYLSNEARAQVLTSLPTLTSRLDTPLLFTFRPREQGGQRDLTLYDRRTFWRSLPPEISDTIALADFEFDLVEVLRANRRRCPGKKSFAPGTILPKRQTTCWRVTN
jgi:3-dehydroquinate dehydratase/shikimate dehydrogenase